MILKVSGMAIWGMQFEYQQNEIIIDTEKDSFSIERHKHGKYITVVISKNGESLKLWYEKMNFLTDSFKFEIIKENDYGKEI